ncbi:hypothetical protein T484DRAFT_3319284 [Baffinella frigidus]|nr:hypothetical protein T484DRAFT_3319284 [Cryptophyta sp. CCMP2293]
MRALSRLSLGRVAAALGKEATATRAACLLVHSAPRWWTMGAERVALAAGLRAARCTPMLGGAAGSRATQTAAGLGDEGRGTPEGVGTPAADPPGEEEMMGGPPGREHELWARAYACPTCDARFARWHKCLSHMKKQQHLKQNSYTTKEQLRLLLTLDTPNSPLREGSKKMLTNSVVLDAIAARNAPGAGEEHEQGGVKKPKQGIKYECPLCNLLTGRWAKMWEHMGDTGHVARSSYRTQEHLRLLLIRTTEPVYAPGPLSSTRNPKP